MAAIFAILNFTIYIQARIAMLDGYLAAFLLGAIAAMLWAMRAPPGRVWPRWIVASMLFGLAVGAKWAAVPYVAWAGLTFLIVRYLDARAARRPHWPGLPAISALGAMGLVSIGTYLLTFLPAFFYRTDPITLASLLPFQEMMYHQQTQVLPHHPYQSSWWTWPLMIRAIR
jgi:dolichyl-phosphate-mannose--protein O-mannosyl transferase